jgi:hypothetical protein
MMDKRRANDSGDSLGLVWRIGKGFLKEFDS